MILVILALAAIGFFLYAVLMRPGKHRRLGMVITGALVMLSVVGIAANDAFSFGLVTRQTTSEQPLIGAKAANVLLKTPLGTNGKKAAYTYRHDTRSKKVITTKPSLTTSTRVIRGNTALVRRTQTKEYFRSDFIAVLFAGSGQNGQLKHTTYTFVLPSNWRVMSTTK